MQDFSPSSDVIAAELAAMRTAAGLVARGASPRVVLESVARHVAVAVGADFLEILQFDEHDRPRVIAAWSSRGDRVIDLDRWALDDDRIARRVLGTRAPTREETREHAVSANRDATSEAAGQRDATGSSVGVPVLLRNRVWGAIVVRSIGDEPLPDQTEARLLGLTELIASAVANSDSRAAAEELAADQAALLRVAELVARGAPPVEVFAAVAEELGRVMHVAGAKMLRYETDGMATFLASWGSLEAGIPAGTRLSITGTSVTGRIFATGRPARVDDYGAAVGEIAAIQRSVGMRSAVGAPIAVDGRLWGALVVGSVDADPLPPRTEQRIAKFADLVAVALSNLEARVALHALADEQAALRRVATVVARGEWDVTSATIVQEVALLFEVDGAVMLRYEPDETVMVLAASGSPDMTAYVGQRLAYDGDNPAAQARRTRRPARQEGFEHARGTLAELTRREGITCAVAGPVIVENQVWGAIVVVSTEPEMLPPDTEERIGQFTELVATAIGNLKARLDLIESRARIVQTADLTRRRFERDLHDGIQQRLVSVALELHGVHESLPAELEHPRARLSEVAAQLSDALEDLRELSRGLHPAILSEGGLEPAIRSLARRSPVPARVRLEHLPRLADPVEVAAYYVVSEALANAGKHARAESVDIGLRCKDGHLEVSVADDGAGGADPAAGTGLTGLVDRVEALGGSISVRSPRGKGTRLIATLPIAG